VVSHYKRPEELSILLQSVLAKITMPAGSFVSTERQLDFQPAEVIDLRTVYRLHRARCAEGETYENSPRFERISDVQSPVDVLREHARRQTIFRVVCHLDPLWGTTSELGY
jgi:hypothetical protein